MGQRRFTSITVCSTYGIARSVSSVTGPLAVTRWTSPVTFFRASGFRSRSITIAASSPQTMNPATTMWCSSRTASSTPSFVPSAVAAASIRESPSSRGLSW